MNTAHFARGARRLGAALTLGAAALLSPRLALAGGDTVGLGLGSSTLSSGVSAKWRAKGGGGLQLVVGPWSTGLDFDGGGTLALNLDGVRDMPKIGSLGPVDVGWSLGAGGGVALLSPPVVAASAFAGINLKLQPAPLELAVELRPRLLVLPTVSGELLNATAHLRWWF